MMLEIVGNEKTDRIDDDNTITGLNNNKKTTTTTTTTIEYQDEFKGMKKVLGKLDPLLNTEVLRPVKVQNQYTALAIDTIEDDDDTADDDDENDEQNTNMTNMTKRRPNRRQRRQRRLQFQHNHSENFEDMLKDEDTTRDAAADILACHGAANGCRGWHPGPEHCGDLLQLGTQQNSNEDIHDYYYYNNHGSSVSNGEYDHHNHIGSSAGLCIHCSSRVACPSIRFHQHSSACRCQLSYPSGLSVVIDHSSSDTAHECRLCGVEGREVMPPAEETPTAKLLDCPRYYD